MDPSEGITHGHHPNPMEGLRIALRPDAVGSRWRSLEGLPPMTRILVVEDQVELLETLEGVLALEGFDVLAARDGQTALDAIQTQEPELVVLDLMLPVLDGFQVLTRLRRSGNATAVLMLTARGEEADRIRGFHLGADDYMVKPFSMLELVERIRAILRRVNPTHTQPPFTSGPIRFDPGTMKMTMAGQPVDLSSKQCQILELFLSHPGVTLDRNEILRHVWPPDSRPSLRAVDVHITRLRRKLEEGGHEGTGCIRSIATAGYRWTLPVART